MKIKLIDLLQRETDQPITKLITMASLSGIANAGILALVNTAADQALDEGEASVQLLFMFIFVIGIYFVSKKYAMIESSILVEKVINTVRARLIDKLRGADLRTLETIGESQFYNRLTQDARTLSAATPNLVNSFQSGVMIFFCMLYLALLSKVAFFITVAMVAGAILVYVANDAEVRENLAKATIEETSFFDIMRHIIDGFKEIKVFQKRNDTIFHRYMMEVLETAFSLKVKAQNTLVGNYMFSQVFFYVLLAVIVFLLPRFDHLAGDIITKTTAAILFIVGPLENLVGAAPVLARANVAIKNLQDLEEQLDTLSCKDTPPTQEQLETLVQFQEINLRDIEFTYRDLKQRPLFTAGPFNLSIRRGETVFIIGGNGSGKTTATKLLTGLYYPEKGSLMMDDTPIEADNYQAYREQFSIILSDFHLFDRFYGLEKVDHEEVHEMIREMDLHEIVTYKNGKFSNIDLSTGQRKRLAMITTLLEHKPICVFDEWPADQDPTFRRHFYVNILPKLKAQGKTIIAISHDDHYFHCADRVLKMDKGRFVPYGEAAEQS